MDLWVVGQNYGNDRAWAFQGVFDSEEKAVEACLNRFYFVGPAKLNETLPDHQVDWKGAYYPKEND